MDFINDKVNENMFSICSLIQIVTKLNVEFLDIDRSASFQLFNSQMPFSLQPFRKDTNFFIDKLLRDKACDNYAYHTDNFRLNYLGVGVWNLENYKGTIIVGPFLSDIPDDVFISKIIDTNKLPLGHRHQLQEYYKILPVLDICTYKNIGLLMVNLAVNPLKNANALFSESKVVNSITREKNELKEENFYSEVELRYKIEKKIQNAVEKGSKEDLLKVMNDFQFNPSHRVPNNPLRAQKNLSFSLNTILRLAAERGGVSPIYIHSISDKYAILVESAASMNELENLRTKMMFDYCDLVKKLSTAGFSPIVRKAIDYINLHFSSELSLNVIAEKINVSSSHLSRQFKKETNSTITEFINKRRIEEAKFLIRQNNNSITEIALMVGFENHNYFSSVFKQITSLTPKEYLCQNKLKE